MDTDAQGRCSITESHGYYHYSYFFKAEVERRVVTVLAKARKLPKVKDQGLNNHVNTERTLNGFGLGLHTADARGGFFCAEEHAPQRHTVETQGRGD